MSGIESGTESGVDTHYDIVIIGGGVAGLSAAYFLSQQSSVLVLERESQPAYHSSGRSAAMYIEGYENPIVAELTRAGKDFFFSPPDDLLLADGAQQLLHRCGGITAATAGESAKLDKYLQNWQPLCPQLTQISPAECQAMIPVIRSSWLQAAAYDPSWHSIDVHELLSMFQRGLRAANGRLQCNAEVTALIQRGQRWEISSAAENFTADIVVNAAGAWANAVAALAGVSSVALTPLRRTAAIVPAATLGDIRHWPLLHTISADLYFKPESPGLMICAQDETPSEAMDAYPHELDVALAAQRFSEVADHPVQRILHQWAGLRTFAPDRVPVVGFDPSVAGFYWLAGQGGFGMQTSPGLGAMVAGHILHNTPLLPQLDVKRLHPS